MVLGGGLGEVLGMGVGVVLAEKFTNFIKNLYTKYRVL